MRMIAEKNSSVRILHLITGLHPGGAETALYKLLSRLDNELFDSVVISLSSGGGPMIRGSIEALGVPVYSLGMQSRRPSPAAAWHLIRMIYQIRPNLIHGWMYHANLAATLARAALLKRVPIVWGVHQSLDLKAEKKLKVAVIRSGARLSAWAERILYVSRVSADQHEAIGYRADRRLVIPIGFDCEQFRPDTGARASVRAELGLSEETPLIGLIARYHPMKDHANFLTAASLLMKQDSTTHFLLAGSCVDFSNRELSAQIATHGLQGRIHLLGERRDIPRLTAALNIACSSSSRWEAFPSVIGEAMACEVPCIVTDVGDSAWIVGETGRVVPPRDPIALSAAWREVLQMSQRDRAALGKRARARIVMNFSLDKVTKRHEELYAEIIGTYQRPYGHRRYDSWR
jgi:glycosyltransferase involved in cell wall biosynthesis